MNYLLDTCVISELVKSTPNHNVINWLNNVPATHLFLSSITIGEIRKGIIKLPNSKKKQRLETWFNTLLQEYKENILPIDLSVAETWETIQGKSEIKGMPLTTADSLIAAVAITHNLVLITRNEKDFVASGVEMLNLWKLEE